MTVPLLVVEELSKAFARGGSSVPAASDVSFAIAPGETLALAGPSGSGKSTVARLIMRLLAPDVGTIRLDSTDLLALSGEPLRLARKHFQMVFQDTTAAFNPRATIAGVLSDPLRVHDIVPAAQRPARIAALLESVGLSPDLARRAVHEISGGQRQRVAIARAMATEPQLIVLDEALSAIDSSLRGDIIRLLLDLQRSKGTAYLFISHDLALVRALAHRVAIMEAGRIVETGVARSVIDAPQSKMGKALVAAVPELKWSSEDRS